MKKRMVLIFLLLCGGLVGALKQDARSRQAVQPSVSTPNVAAAVASGSSPAVRSFTAGDARVVANTGPMVFAAGRGAESSARTQSAVADSDGAVARSSGVAMPTPSLSFGGLANFDNITAYNLVIIPPDTTGDVGPGHYVQAVNSLIRIFDKSGNPLTPPFKISQLFQPLGTVCATRNDGEPSVVYDELADRWLISQYCNPFPPFRQMIAVSKTGDPMGSYYIYEFVMPNIRLNDLARFGVWPDGYYMSTEEFTGGDYSGMGLFAFDRAKMLAGDPSASYIYFHRPSIGPARWGNLLPSDLDGLRPPRTGAPNVFSGYSATEYGETQDAIRLFDFHADFTTPANSTFTERPESPLPVAAFNPLSLEGRNDIHQPPPGERLDANSDRLNSRAAYRNFGGSESLVLNQTVALSTDPYRAGVRIYELRRSGGAFSVTQQATLGDNASSRWIASAASDHQGNIAVGYNHVRDDKQPSLYYTGRLATDPPGSFRDEGTLIDGTGVQRAFGFRWGDYSAMSIDPVDDCTFWMTGEYYTLASQQFSEYTWLTRIGKFKFAECTPAPRGVITGTVIDKVSGQPIGGARITSSVYSRATATNGSYGQLALPPAAYQVTASAHGYVQGSVTVNVIDGQTVTQDFALKPVAVLATTSSQVTAESCAANGAPDPGETVSISVSLKNNGALPTKDLTATLLASGGVTGPGPAQSYGTMPVNGAPVSRTFSFAVGPGVACGSTLVLTFHLTDGASDLGDLTLQLQTGTPKVVLRQNFDRNQLVQLPPRWSRSETRIDPDEPAGERNWRVSRARSTSPTKAAWVPDSNYRGLSEMVSPVMKITSPNARLTFQNYYKLEATFLLNRLWDGTVLEISYDGGAWQDILAAGGTFESGGYNGPIDACCQNPFAGRLGWAGRSGINETAEFITSAVRLPASAAGHNIRLRWVLATDIGNGVPVDGQFIDDVLITDGYTCDC